MSVDHLPNRAPYPPNSREFGRFGARIGRNCPTLAGIGSFSPEFGSKTTEIGTDSTNSGLNLGQVRPISAKIGPNLGDFDRIGADIPQVWAKLDRLMPQCGHFRLSPGPIRPGLPPRHCGEVGVDHIVRDVFGLVPMGVQKRGHIDLPRTSLTAFRGLLRGGRICGERLAQFWLGIDNFGSESRKAWHTSLELGPNSTSMDRFRRQQHAAWKVD